MIFFLSLSVLAGLLVVGAIIDIESRRLPNWLTAAVAALYGLYVVTSPIPVDWITSFVVAGSVFALGFACFACSVMGGGDVKLLAALTLWAGIDHIADLLLITALAGGLLAVLVMGWRRLSTLPMAIALGQLQAQAVKLLALEPHGDHTPGHAVEAECSHHDSLPYGVAIAAGGFAVIFALLQR